MAHFHTLVFSRRCFALASVGHPALTEAAEVLNAKHGVDIVAQFVLQRAK